VRGFRNLLRTASEANDRLRPVLDDAQHVPVVIRDHGRDVAVVLSMSEYDRLRTGNVRAFLELRNEIATQAAANGLIEERLADLLRRNEP